MGSRGTHLEDIRKTDSREKRKDPRFIIDFLRLGLEMLSKDKNKPILWNNALIHGEKMKDSMSALDIKICLEEIKDIEGAWTGKIYEIQGVFLFKFKPPEEERTDLIIEPGRRIHLTSMKYDTPKRPTSFAMLLRKYLTNSKLIDIRQPDMERIVELEFEGRGERFILIAELFGEGNLILCDSGREIIKPLKIKSWKHRELKPGREYTPPPKRGGEISSVSRGGLRDFLAESPDLVRGLARNLNIGGRLAEEICARVGIEKEIGPGKLSESDYEDLYSKIKGLLASEVSPQIAYERDDPADVTPFPFEIHSDLETEPFESFNEALDTYFQSTSKRRVKGKQERRLEEKLRGLKSRLKKQKKRLRDLKEKVQRTKKIADAISTHHRKIDAALENLKKIEKSKGWKNIEEEIQRAAESGEEWANLIESVQPKSGTIELDLPEVSVTLDMRLSAFDNASKFYERYKRSKNKIEGARKAIEGTKTELKEVREEGIEVPSKRAPKRKRKKMWYERYRWFYSSDGMLVIAGRNVETNQEIVEKHMSSEDLYFHADLKGAPHTVVKSEGEKIPEKTIEEAARFAIMHSRAWRRGLASGDVYWVEPQQVSKEAPAGEYLPKGSYMIRGERNYLTVPLEAGLGFMKRADLKILMCGPPSAVDAHSDILIKIKPGPIKKSDLAHKIRTELQERTGGEVDVDELMRILPPGSGMVVD